ncbi:unnamed protein product [Ranitomeya imitator]|uniref:PH domain-containing protein n=1 Tax=Ranitomeya imitator TaxID=111125 RepID=A0ABN9KXZ3_9NEOB|nr:unnamed protein product [Ranitomeya imitator]
MTSRSCDRYVITGPALIQTLGPEAAACTAHRRQDYKSPSEATGLQTVAQSGRHDVTAADGQQRRTAWKRRWFILRSGRLTGDPDVLEYYKNDHAKKPIRIIDLNLCEQVDAGLVFPKKEFEHSYIFDIKTIDRIFYLVAESEEEMNRWVRSICDICGFNPTEEELLQQEVRGSGRKSHPDSAKSAPSETDCNDNVATHKTSSSAHKNTGLNGYFQQTSVYDSPSRAGSCSESSLYNLPRSYSQDVLPKAVSPSGTDVDGDQSVFNMSGASLLESQLRHMSISYDIPPSSGSTYQIPRTVHENSLGQSTTKLETIADVPPPRPPKPYYSSERSPAEHSLTRTASETDSNYCVPTGGMATSRSNTVSNLELNKYRKDMSSQELYDVPRPFSSDRASSLEGFHFVSDCICCS